MTKPVSITRAMRELKRNKTVSKEIIKTLESVIKENRLLKKEEREINKTVDSLFSSMAKELDLDFILRS